jgi:hypothetical protein
MVRGTIVLTVQDSSTNAPLWLVTATLVKIDRNEHREIYTYAVSDTLGVVRFNSVPPSKYEISLQYMGYYMKVIPNINIEVKDLLEGQRLKDLGVVKLRENITELNEVVVRDRTVPIKYLGDTIQYNAAAYKMSDTDVLEDFFKKLPGWSVDKNGRITAHGKVIEQITVNGRIFFLDDPVFVSKNLPAKVVKNIKLFEKQSAKSKFTGIDDGARTNTVDVTVKEEMLNGWLADINAGGGTEGRYKGKTFIANFNKYNQIGIIGNISNLNEKSGISGSSQMFSPDSYNYSLGTNLNFMSRDSKQITDVSYKFNGDNNIMESEIYRQNYIKDSSFVYERSSRNANNGTAHVINGEISRNTSKTLFVLKPAATYSHGSYSNSNNYRTLGEASGFVINEGESKDMGKSDQESILVDFQVVKRMSKVRRTLSLNGKIGFDKIDNDGMNKISADSIQTYNIHNQTAKLTAQLSYTEPLTKKLVFSGNWGVSASFSDMNKETYNPDNNNGLFTLLDPVLSDKSDNTEFKQNIELSIQKPKGKGETSFYMAGVSILPSYVKRNSAEESFDKWFVNISPKVEFRMLTPKLFQTFITYTGRANTPSLSQMMPVPDNTDPLYFRMGNRNLKSEYEHKANLNLRFIKVAPGSYANGIFLKMDASYFTSKIVNKSWFDENGVQYSMPYNDKGDYSINTMLMMSYPFFKGALLITNSLNAGYYNSISYIDGNKNITKRSVFGDKADITVSIGDLFLTAGVSFNYEESDYSIYTGKKNSTWRNNIDGIVKYILPFEIDARTSLSYQFFSGYRSQNDKPYLLWNLDISKALIKNKLIVTLSANDILNQNKNLQKVMSDSYIQETRYNVIRQYFLFTVTYKFFTGGTSGAFRERVNSILKNQELNAIKGSMAEP